MSRWSVGYHPSRFGQNERICPHVGVGKSLLFHRFVWLTEFYLYNFSSSELLTICSTRPTTVKKIRSPESANASLWVSLCQSEQALSNCCRKRPYRYPDCDHWSLTFQNFTCPCHDVDGINQAINVTVNGKNWHCSTCVRVIVIFWTASVFFRMIPG